MNPADQTDLAPRLSDLAVRFQGAWQANPDDPQAIDLASFLPPPGDPLRVAALVRLIPIDLAARWRNGVPLSLEDYLVRYPELGPIELVPPTLIAAEYRIRADHGVISPNTVLRQRFPKQYPDVERIIQSDPSIGAQTITPVSLPSLLLTKELIVGGHYRLNRLIGRGGFGEVWHGTDLRGNIDKAVKILTRAADSDEAQKELESLDLIKRINHPYLLRTESYFVEKDRLFIVLELADATLRDVLKKTQTESRTGIRSDELLRHMKHAAEGLDFLHKQGILHRDIKPENILLVGDFGKVADFGLAKEAHNKQSTKADFAGTVVYSAPETWDGRVTTRSDQYSLACTYFEMRTGRVLFSGKTFQEVFLKHMQANPSLEPLPDLEQDMLRKALSKKPEDRFETCVAFIKALEDAVLASGSKVVESKPPLDVPNKTRQQPGKTTQEAYTLASRDAPKLHGGLTDAARLKWNQPPTKSRGGPWIMLALLAIAGLGGAGAFFLLQPEPPVVPVVEPKQGGEPVPQVAKIDPVPNPAIKPKIEPKIEPPPKPPEKIPDKPPEPKPPEPKPPSPERVQLAEARENFNAKKFAESRKTLESIDLFGPTAKSDADLNRGGLELYADLLRAGAYTLPELRQLNLAVADHPLVKPAFAASMTKRLEGALTDWPMFEKEWILRFGDCDRAEKDNPMVQAMKAEAMIESKSGRPLPLKEMNLEPTYVSYVRARILVNESDPAAAPNLLVRIPKSEPWFVDERKRFAALILQSRAVDLMPNAEGSPRLFARVADADLAGKWRRHALELLGNPSFEQQALAFLPEELLCGALAAACGSEPDFAACKAIGSGLLADAKFAKSESAIDLILASPFSFPRKFAELRTRIDASRFDPILKLGDEQRKASPKNASIRARQALLLYTKARATEKQGLVSPKELLSLDSAAVELEPNEPAYQVARSRDLGLIALEGANQRAEPLDKIETCNDGLKKSIVPPRSEDAELWPDLGRVRALLSLQIGRNSDWKSHAAKKAFQDGISSAKPALDKASEADKAGIALALAQCYEALAYLSRVDAPQNFEEAVRVFGEAAKRDPKIAFQRGRCLYRWAELYDGAKDDKQRADLLRKAVAELQIVAKIPDFSAAAEAGYLEGVAYWDLTKRFTASPKAFEAFDRSLKAAADQPQTGAAWAGKTLADFVEMTKRQAKSVPEGSTAELLKIEPAVKSLANSLAGNAEFDAALGNYRNLLAETSADAAGRVIAGKAKDFKKYREHFDRAVELKHSDKHAMLALKRAVGFKKNAEALGLTEVDLLTLRKETIAAIDQVSDQTARTLLRKEFDAGWQ